MSKQIEISLTDEIAAQVDALASGDGVSREEWIRDAVRAQLFLRQFEQARTMILDELDARGERYTDEDVFKMVS